MSDTTGAAVEVPSGSAEGLAAPVVETPQTEAEAEVQLQLEEGRGPGVARRNARKRAEARAQQIERETQRRAQAEAARDRALGQSRKEAGTPEGGQFAKDTDAAAPESAAASEAVAEAPAEQASTSPEAVTKTPAVETSGTDQAPDGWIDIPLPDGHPLRARGRTHIRALKEQEADVRNGINAAVRLRESEAERERLARDVALLEARRAALSGDVPDPTTDPHIQELLKQIREAPGFGEKMADAVLDGLKARTELKVINAERTATSEYELQAAAGKIAADIEAQASNIFKVWAASGEVPRYLHGPRGLIAQYFEAVDQRNARDGVSTRPSPDEFFVWARQAYAADPRVRAEIERIQREDRVRSEEAIRAKVRAELEAEQRKKAEEVAQRRAALPPTSRGLPASSTPATQTADERKPSRPGQYRQDAKARIRARFAPQ